MDNELMIDGFKIACNSGRLSFNPRSPYLMWRPSQELEADGTLFNCPLAIFAKHHGDWGDTAQRLNRCLARGARGMATELGDRHIGAITVTVENLSGGRK